MLNVSLLYSTDMQFLFEIREGARNPLHLSLLTHPQEAFLGGHLDAGPEFRAAIRLRQGQGHTTPSCPAQAPAIPFPACLNAQRGNPMGLAQETTSPNFAENKKVGQTPLSLPFTSSLPVAEWRNDSTRFCTSRPSIVGIPF